MDRLNKYMEAYKTPHETRERLRAYVIYCRCVRTRHAVVVCPRVGDDVGCCLSMCVRSLKKELGYMSLLDELSPHLRGVLTLHCYGPAISSVPFFNIRQHGLRGEERASALLESNTFLQNVRWPPRVQWLFVGWVVILHLTVVLLHCRVVRADCHAPGPDGVQSPRSRILRWRRCGVDVRLALAWCGGCGAPDEHVVVPTLWRCCVRGVESCRPFPCACV